MQVLLKDDRNVLEELAETSDFLGGIDAELIHDLHSFGTQQSMQYFLHDFLSRVIDSEGLLLILFVLILVMFNTYTDDFKCFSERTFFAFADVNRAVLGDGEDEIEGDFNDDSTVA